MQGWLARICGYLECPDHRFWGVALCQKWPVLCAGGLGTHPTPTPCPSPTPLLYLPFPVRRTPSLRSALLGDPVRFGTE